MLKAYKIEINPSEEQKYIIDRTIGVCRFIYNFYLTINKKHYEEANKFLKIRSIFIWHKLKIY